MMVVLMMMMMMSEAVGREERFLRLSVGRTRALAGRTCSHSLHHIAHRATTDNNQASQLSSINCTIRCYQYLKSAKAININSNSKQRRFSCAKDYSETFRTRRQELGGSVGVQPEENDVLDDCVTLFNVLALTATTI